jgi:hypothetical protein
VVGDCQRILRASTTVPATRRGVPASTPRDEAERRQVTVMFSEVREVLQDRKIDSVFGKTVRILGIARANQATPQSASWRIVP